MLDIPNAALTEKQVILCSIVASILGFSPGARVLDITVRLQNSKIGYLKYCSYA